MPKMSSRRPTGTLVKSKYIVMTALAAVIMSIIIPPSVIGQNPATKSPVTTAPAASPNTKSTAIPTKLPDKGSSPLKSAADKSSAPRPTPRIEPQIPRANRNNKARVFLEKADLMYQTETDSFVIVTGNVEFSHGPTLMYCDSAHFYPGSESLDAFGDVRIRQGDTLFIYADELNYSGSRHIAYLYGTEHQDVRMINRDVTLTTPTFIYDLASEYGYYNEGGQLTDRQNRLTSREGEYVPGTKDASFFNRVVLTSRTPGDTIFTDTLYYNTATHLAQLESPSTIINKQAVIYTSYGTYDTNTSQANLYNRSKIVTTTGATLEGDTLFYDRELGFGEAFGNMEIVDTANQMILTGDYGYYNELLDSAFATGHALAREFSQGDTLYLHSRYLYSYCVFDTTHIPEDTVAGTPASMSVDTTHVMVAHPRVRFFRSDLQGICDSMSFEQKDTMIYMHHHPVVWNGERQISGNIIKVHLNDSTVEQAWLPDFGLTAEHIEENFFNQLSGKEMIAYFRAGELYQVDVNGNVEAIMLPMENDSTFNKIVNVESSFMTAWFEGNNILKAKMWPETSGTVTPLYLAKKSLFYLPKFKWYTDMRPVSPEDVMHVPESMEQLMADIPPSHIIPRRRVNDDGEVYTEEPEDQETTSEEPDTQQAPSKDSDTQQTSPQDPDTQQAPSEEPDTQEIET